jgi:hypothetical protein
MQAVRMTWADDGCVLRSGCGRFAIGTGFRGPFAYRKLTDLRSGKDYLCRTADGARAAARGLLAAGASRGV